MSEKFNMEAFSDFETDKSEQERLVFGGVSAEEMKGLSPNDRHTTKQLRMIFALALELGLKKDDVKETYEIDSLSDLTVREAGELIESMLSDSGETKEKFMAAQTKKESRLEWTVVAGISQVGNSFAKCGHCCNFSGENTLDTGKCELGIIKGTYSGGKVIPMTEDCFRFKHGDKIE